MSCGHLSARNAAKNGFGWRSIGKHARSSVSRLVHARKQQRANYGHRFRLCTANAQCVIPIFGRRTQLFCLPSVIVRLEKRVVEQVTLNGLTTRCASGVVDWFEGHSHSRKSWRTTSVQSGTSFTIITHGNAQN